MRMDAAEKVGAALTVLGLLGMIACFLCAGLLPLSGDQQGALMVGGVLLLIPTLVFSMTVFI